jgi:hypothetical protein
VVCADPVEAPDTPRTELWATLETTELATDETSGKVTLVCDELDDDPVEAPETPATELGIALGTTELEEAVTAVDKTLVCDELGNDAIEVSETELAAEVAIELKVEVVVGKIVWAALDPVPATTVLCTMTVVT